MKYITEYYRYETGMFVRIRTYKTINLYLDGYGILTSHKKWKSILDKLVNLSNRWYIPANQFEIFKRKINEDIYYFTKFYITDIEGGDKIPDDIKSEIISDLTKISKVFKYTLHNTYLEIDMQLDVQDVPVKTPWLRR